MWCFRCCHILLCLCCIKNPPRACKQTHEHTSMQHLTDTRTAGLYRTQCLSENQSWIIKCVFCILPSEPWKKTVRRKDCHWHNGWYEQSVICPTVKRWIASQLGFVYAAVVSCLLWAPWYTAPRERSLPLCVLFVTFQLLFSVWFRGSVNSVYLCQCESQRQGKLSLNYETL